MEEKETAMKISDDVPVFVEPDGSYSTKFPEENIVDRGDSEYVVYGFVGSQSDYEEKSWTFETKESALEFASKIYGEHSEKSQITEVREFSYSGEVFEVEVHAV